MTDEVKLFGFWASPFSKRAEMGLKLKGVQYEYFEEDLANKSSELVKYNPVYKSVPVLVHNGKPIAESFVILEYIDETWKGPPILPKDPYERAKARFWAHFLDEKCWPVMRKTWTSTGEERDKAKEELSQVLKVLENELMGKTFFGGDSIGLVDIAGNFVGFWFKIIAEVIELEILTKEKFPNLFKWIVEYNNCSIVTENVPPMDKFVETVKSSFSK